MLLFRWVAKLFLDVIVLGIVNRSFFLSFTILALLLAALVIIGAQISAPFIYTLF